MRRGALLAVPLAIAVLTGCGGGTKLINGPGPVLGIQSQTPHAVQKLGFPSVATKNTTRIGGGDPIADAAGVALAVYPSSARGTHPPAVVLAPTSNWQAAIASSLLMAAPLRAPTLLSGSSSLPAATAEAINTLAPTGSGSSGGAQVIRVGDVPQTNGLRSATISGKDAYSLAAAIDRFAAAASGRTTSSVIVTTADNAAYAMPAAALAAESGIPVLFVNGDGIPEPTRQALLSHQSPHIYVLGPSSAIPDGVVKQLGKYGAVKRISGNDASSNSIAFATFRDPPCPYGKPCAHVPGSFGWAMRSPGHGYELINSHRPLDAAAAAPLAATGTFGPALIIDDGNNMPKSLLNFFLDYATPGYTQEGPTAAVYNHGWVIGDPSAVSLPVQAEMDSLLEAIPQR